jgi:hypothetical protein
METAGDKSWFGAKTLFRHPDLEREEGRRCYEERVVLISASNEDEALRLAEEEAKEYASGSETKFLGYVNVFRIDDPIRSGAEVFSIMRSADVTEDDFVTHYYDDGTFHTR